MKKSTVAVVVVFLALALAGVLTLKQKAERGISRISFKNIKPESIDAIVITGPQAVELKRDPGGAGWQLANQRPADAAAVKALLDALVRVESSHLVTRDEQRFMAMGVDAASTTEVTATAAGRVVARLAVGTAAPGGEGVYVRVDNAVYQVPGLEQHRFTQAKSQWQERRLFMDKPEEVTRVQVRLAGGQAYALVKQENSWALEPGAEALPAGFRFDPAAAGALVANLLNARAEEILESDPGEEKTGLSDKADTLVFEVKGDAKARQLRLGSAVAAGDNSNVYARVVGGADVAVLNVYTAKMLRRSRDDLRDLQLTKLDTAGVTGLSVKNGKVWWQLRKEAAGWKVEKSSSPVAPGLQLDSALVAQRLASLGSWRGVAFATEQAPAKAGLEQPQGLVQVTQSDGKKVTLVKVGKATRYAHGDGFWAQGNIDGLVYVVDAYTEQRLLGGLETLQRTEPTADKAAGGGAAGAFGQLDAKTLQQLPEEIRRKIQAEMRAQAEQQEMQRMMAKEAAQKTAQAAGGAGAAGEAAPSAAP